MRGAPAKADAPQASFARPRAAARRGAGRARRRHVDADLECATARARRGRRVRDPRRRPRRRRPGRADRAQLRRLDRRRFRDAFCRLRRRSDLSDASARPHAYILEHSGARLIFVDVAQTLARLREQRRRCRASSSSIRPARTAWRPSKHTARRSARSVPSFPAATKRRCTPTISPC